MNKKKKVATLALLQNIWGYRYRKDIVEILNSKMKLLFQLVETAVLKRAHY